MEEKISKQKRKESYKVFPKEEKETSAWEKYQKTIDPAYKEYRKIQKPAWDRYRKTKEYKLDYDEMFSDN